MIVYLEIGPNPSTSVICETHDCKNYYRFVFEDFNFKGLEPLFFMIPFALISMGFSIPITIFIIRIAFSFTFFLAFYWFSKDYFDVKSIILMIFIFTSSWIWWELWLDIWRQLFMIIIMFVFLRLLETKKFKYAGITLGLMGLTHISFFLMYPFLLMYSYIKKNYKEVFSTNQKE